MDEILDQPLGTPDRSTVKYGGFWQRFGAVFIDGLILAPVTFGLTYFNITSWKSSLLLIVVSLLGIAYKPVMEIMYGASLGKMALKLKVTNLEFEKADVGQILLRNIFHIVPQLITLAFTVSLYMDPEFESVTGFMEFSLLTQKYSMLQFANFASGALTIVDVIMLISDQQKRTLHDRIGGTLVVDNS